MSNILPGSDVNVPKEISQLLNRMYNWKMTSAYNAATTIPTIPTNALLLLQQMSEEFGNCGWGEGEDFDKLRDTNNTIAEMLGFIWNDDLDYWVSVTSTPKL